MPHRIKSYTILLILIAANCYSQSYEELLTLRLEEIKKLTYFNNSVVVYPKGSGYGSTYDSWGIDRDFFENEMVVGKDGEFYMALVDNRGKNPLESPNEWQLIPYIHPYFFLRDTARTEDLSKLLSNPDPYIKTYAFGALANRNFNGLYDVLLKNLSDTTRILQMTSDYGYDVCPADLMIMYLMNNITSRQKKNILGLIETDYQHLAEAKKYLEEK